MNTNTHESMKLALKAAIQLLPAERHATSDDVAAAVKLTIGLMQIQKKEVDAQELRKLIEARINVFQEESTGLSDNRDHVPWLPDAKSSEEWPFWQRYERYLADVQDRPVAVVRGIDRTTDEILGLLENPNRAGQWQRTGLVIGQVQSGKTGQFIGLAAKAADAGYRLIIILAGALNDLRAQTQVRIDEGLLGFDTQYQLRSDEEAKSSIGVGAMAGEERLPIASLTNSTEKGDFNKSTASKVGIPIGNFPVVLVIKKHRSIIDYLRTWVTEFHGIEDPATGRKVVRDVPLFIIDDEADHASINTADLDADPTKINAAIRELLSSFERSSYVGYTATPYANIYIDPDVEHETYGNDLFPESFIRALPAPSNYLGPERLFGIPPHEEDDAEDEESGVNPLNLVRYAKDTESWVPEKHRSSHVPLTDLPESLVKAIKSFILTCAARRARGQVNVHNSMLVHVTRFTKVQGHVRDQIDDYVRLLEHTLRDRYSQASSHCLEDLEMLWNSDFVSTTKTFPQDEIVKCSWAAVSKEIVPAVRKMQVKAINGVAKDALDYYENRNNGLYVIAVGGQRLSRGLTLEGLSVSYYLRFAKMYDTLLQMGRWFGYRPGYEDLCRLYTTMQLEAAYKEITQATKELRRDLKEMAALGQTPRQFGLKVRTSSLGLSITANNKMRQGTKVRISYSGELAETTIFPLSEGIPKLNFDCLLSFTQALLGSSRPNVDESTGSLVWTNIEPELVCDKFFDIYRTASEANRIRPEIIASYIRKCAEIGELGKWTVRVVSRRGGADSIDVAGHNIGLVTRAPSKSAPESTSKYTIKRVLSPRDESLDLNEDQLHKALVATKKAAEGTLDRSGRPRVPTVPTGAPLRRQRRTDQPLLLLYVISPPQDFAGNEPIPLVGFAVSFPFSRRQDATEYVVNIPWWNQNQYDFDEEEEMQ